MVNTFLPYADFRRSARTLDNKRLGKQRVEAYQILRILQGKQKTSGFTKHPVVAMWRGHITALKHYINCMIYEWIKRGFKNNMQTYNVDESKLSYPWWIGWSLFHKSHQASLYRKDPTYYKKFSKLSNIIYSYSYIWPGNIQPTTDNKIHNIHKYAKLFKK